MCRDSLYGIDLHPYTTVAHCIMSALLYRGKVNHDFRAHVLCRIAEHNFPFPVLRCETIFDAFENNIKFKPLCKKPQA